MNRIFKLSSGLILLITFILLGLLLTVQYSLFGTDNIIVSSKAKEILKISDFTRTSIIYISLEEPSLKDVFVLINGDKVNSFNKDSIISLRLYQGDVIEIDGTRHSKSFKVKVVQVDDNILYPYANLDVLVENNIEKLAIVKLK